MARLMRLLEGLPLTIVSGVALLISLIFLLCGIHTPFDPAWLAVIISGLPLAYLALTRLFYQHWLSSALLITIAMAACLSVGQLFAAGEVAFIMALGAILEDFSVARAKRGLRTLVSLVPDKGRRITDDNQGEEIVPIEEIRVGDILRVLPGERITIDGEIVSGSTSVDQAVITGESLPVDKTLGDSVFCGTMNCFGSIDIRATKVGHDTSLQKMILLAEEAENNKAPMQRIVDRWATWLVPIALLIAILAGIITGQWIRAVTVLVVFCPCALVLATPVSIVAGIGQATKFGVLVKSGEALERMGTVDCITFDKTGTLTQGELSVSDIIPFNDINPSELLSITASAEARSEHPIGKAIVAHAKDQALTLQETADFSMTLGQGVSATIGGRAVICGNSGFMSSHSIPLSDEMTAAIRRLQEQGKALVITAIEGHCIGLLALADVIRPAAQEMIAALTAMNVETVMLTGDNNRAAEHLAATVGIQQVRSELLPEDKVAAIKALQNEGKTVCMIGDGVNDAAALQTASVGVAMGTMGSDIAIDAADIALMGDDIANIPYLKRLAYAVRRSIKVNITISMAINAIAIILSVLGLLTPVTGALVHNAGSVLVVLNAALLYDRKI